MADHGDTPRNDPEPALVEVPEVSEDANAVHGDTPRTDPEPALVEDTAAESTPEPEPVSAPAPKAPKAKGE